MQLAESCGGGLNLIDKKRNDTLAIQLEEHRIDQISNYAQRFLKIENCNCVQVYYEEVLCFAY